MNNKNFFLIVMAFLIVVVMTTDCLAYRQRGRKPESKPAKIFHTDFALVPKLTGGYVLGGAADAIEEYEGDEWQNKLIYGVGMAFEYYLKPKYAAAFNLEALWKKLPGDDYNTIRILTYSTYAMYRFTPQRGASYYMKPEMGFITASVPDCSSLELGTHFFVRMGLGYFRYTSGWTNVRMEVYYKIAFTSDYEDHWFGGSRVNFDVQYLCLEVGFGIPL